MDVLVQQLMKIALLLTGVTTTVVVGSAYVENNSALSPKKAQPQQVKSVDVNGTGAPTATAPQNPLPPGALEVQGGEGARGGQRSISIGGVTELRGDGPVAPGSPGLISE